MRSINVIRLPLPQLERPRARRRAEPHHRLAPLFSSASVDWETPWALFLPLHREFRFTLDAAATLTNAKLPRFYSIADDGLRKSWAGERVWLNPPYGKTLALWVAKAVEEANLGTPVVMLLPARTDTGWFHDLVLPLVKRGDAEIRFERGRVRFVGGRHSATFPSIVVPAVRGIGRAA